MNPSSPTHTCTHTRHTLYAQIHACNYFNIIPGVDKQYAILVAAVFVVLFEQSGHGSKMFAVCCRMKTAAHWDHETWSKPYKILNYLQRFFPVFGFCTVQNLVQRVH